jgi:hypothetical protein
MLVRLNIGLVALASLPPRWLHGLTVCCEPAGFAPHRELRRFALGGRQAISLGHRPGTAEPRAGIVPRPLAVNVCSESALVREGEGPQFVLADVWVGQSKVLFPLRFSQTARITVPTCDARFGGTLFLAASPGRPGVFILPWVDPAGLLVRSPVGASSAPSCTLRRRFPSGSAKDSGGSA